MSDVPQQDRLVEFLFRVWSSFYDQAVFQKPFYRRVHAGVLRAIDAEAMTPPKSVIDVGCGTAQLTADLAARWPAAVVAGVDMTQGMLAVARERVGAGGPDLVRANVYALPFAPGSVDLATSTISYHWYLEPRRALGELRRVLRPGGRLVLATLATRLLRGTAGHSRLATVNDTLEDLTASGFAVLHVERVRPAVRIFVAS